MESHDVRHWDSHFSSYMRCSRCDVWRMGRGSSSNSSRKRHSSSIRGYKSAIVPGAVCCLPAVQRIHIHFLHFASRPAESPSVCSVLVCFLKNVLYQPAQCVFHVHCVFTLALSNALVFTHVDDTTGAVWRHFMFIYVWRSTVTSIVLDTAATLFTPEKSDLWTQTPTHTSIGIVV